VYLEKREFEAGNGQLIVVYVNEDTGAGVDADDLAGELARDAAERQAKGWRLSSVTSFPLRQMGTAGNILFQSGGQYATQVAMLAVYSQPAR
jgi:hypothetical protein